MHFHHLFRNPPTAYRLVPFWFWNGDMDTEKIVHQIREMAEKGIGNKRWNNAIRQDNRFFFGAFDFLTIFPRNEEAGLVANYSMHKDWYATYAEKHQKNMSELLIAHLYNTTSQRLRSSATRPSVTRTCEPYSSAPHSRIMTALVVQH
jgi:hypothetical protein